MSSQGSKPFDVLRYMLGFALLSLGEAVLFATFFVLTGHNVDEAGKYAQRFGGQIIAFAIMNVVLAAVLPRRSRR